MNDIWWTQIASARRFLEQITEELLLYKSVLLSVPEWLPWSDAMCTELEKNLIASGSGRSLEFIDCPEDDIGRFLLENYAKESRLCKPCAEKPLIRANVQTVCRKCAAAFLHKERTSNLTI